MELEELQSRMEHLRHLEPRENGPETPQKAYLTMERDEMIRYIEFLQERLDEEKRARELSDKRALDLLGKIDRMGEQHSQEMQDLLQKNQELQQSIMDLTSAIRLSKKHRFSVQS